MKKFKLLASTLLLTFSISSVSLADAGITILINSVKLKSDVEPHIVNNRTMVPIRAIAENMGAKVDWNQSEQLVTISSDETTMNFKLDSNQALVNGREVSLEQPITVVKERTMVPLRFISENMGALVKWNGKSKTVVIEKNTNTSQGRPFDYSDTDKVITDMDKFVAYYGKPQSVKKEYNDYLGGETYHLKYSFGKVHFIPDYDSKAYDLVYLSSSENVLGMPRGIKIGQSVEEIIAKFPNDTDYDYVNDHSEDEDNRLLYKVERDDLNSIGVISYDKDGHVKKIKYFNDYDSGAASGIMLSFKDNKLVNIEFYYGYM